MCKYCSQMKKERDQLQADLLRFTDKMRQEANYEMVYGREQYAKGIEMTLTGMNRILAKNWNGTVPPMIETRGFLFSTVWNRMPAFFEKSIF